MSPCRHAAVIASLLLLPPGHHPHRPASHRYVGVRPRQPRAAAQHTHGKAPKPAGVSGTAMDKDLAGPPVSGCSKRHRRKRQPRPQSPDLGPWPQTGRGDPRLGAETGPHIPVYPASSPHGRADIAKTLAKHLAAFERLHDLPQVAASRLLSPKIGAIR